MPENARAIRFSREARTFLRREAEYLRHYSNHAARHLLQHVVDLGDQLAQFPYIGPQRQGALVPGARQIVMGDYVVYYQVDPDFVSILTIRHGRMSAENPDPDEDFDYEE